MKVELAGKEVELGSITGKDVKDILRLAKKLDNSVDASSDALEILEVRDALACRITGLSMEEWDFLTVEDQGKVRDYIAQKAQDKLDFGKPSPR